MQKTLTIDGKEIVFKSDGVTPLRYRKEFGRDFFADVIKVISALDDMRKGTIDYEKLDTSVFYDMVYTWAKNANEDIGDAFGWFGSFDAFPIFEVVGGLQEFLLSNMKTIVKKTRKK